MVCVAHIYIYLVFPPKRKQIIFIEQQRRAVSFLRHFRPAIAESVQGIYKEDDFPWEICLETSLSSCIVLDTFCTIRERRLHRLRVYNLLTGLQDHLATYIYIYIYVHTLGNIIFLLSSIWEIFLLAAIDWGQNIFKRVY